MIEHLGLAPAWIAGSSFGASITLRLAGERPEPFRGLIAHEPPLISLLADDPAAASMLADVGSRVGAVVERIAAGDHAGAADALPIIEVATFAGAGHIPHVTHPDAYVDAITAFIQRSSG